MTDDSRSYRDALGRYPTGVAIVTAFDGGQAVGMTVNSFASVSLEPPLVLWSLERGTTRYGLFRNARAYAINVLAHDQAPLAQACAQEADLMTCGVGWDGGTAPLVAGAVARFLCRQDAVHTSGDHDIIIGRVGEFDMPRDVPALTFYRSGYCEPG